MQITIRALFYRHPHTQFTQFCNYNRSKQNARSQEYQQSARANRFGRFAAANCSESAARKGWTRNMRCVAV